MKAMKTTICYLVHQEPSLRGAQEVAYFYDCAIVPRVGENIELRPQISSAEQEQKVYRGPVILVQHSINERSREHNVSVVFDPVVVSIER